MSSNMVSSLLDSAVGSVRRCGVVKGDHDLGVRQVQIFGDIFDVVADRWPGAPLKEWENKLSVFEEMKPKNVPPLVKSVVKELSKLEDAEAALFYIKSVDKKVYKYILTDPSEEALKFIFALIQSLVRRTFRNE